MEPKAIPEEFKKRVAMIINTSLAQARFEYDIVKAALQCGLDPLEELKSAIKVMNDIVEEGNLEWHVAEILKEIKEKENK